jgi:hypothetical protein
MAFTRPGYNNNNNKNRNRNRNRRHNNMGGNTGGGGGNTANRVYDSNGPDVKLRGTAQTIAEKYMQLGRDAQSSGDIVMAESYYQFGDHYYRLWLAVQPAGQPIQFSRRMAEEDMEDEAGEGGQDGDDDGVNGDAPAAEGAEVPGSSEEGAEQQPSDGQQQDGQYPRQNRQRDFNNNNNNRDGTNNRDGGRNTSRQRWPRRNDRNQQQDGNGQPFEAANAEAQAPRPERNDRPERSERQTQPQSVEAAHEPASEANGDWEAPSFLKRPAPAVVAEDAYVEEAPAAPRARRTRAEPKAAAEDAPQGD